MDKEEKERIMRILYNMTKTNWFKAGSELNDEKDVRFKEYLARVDTLGRIRKLISREPVKRKTGVKSLDCKYWKTKDGYVSGCGYRVAYSKFWHVCPICGKNIVVVNQNALEE